MLTEWTYRDEIAALAFERADMWGNLLAQAWSSKPGQVPSPLVFTHPDRQAADEHDRKVTSDPAEIRAFFARLG